MKRSIKIRKSDLAIFTLSFCVTFGVLTAYEKVSNSSSSTLGSLQSHQSEILIPEPSATQAPNPEVNPRTDEKSATNPRAIPRTPRETPSGEMTKSLDYFEVGESYPWEDDPTRYGLAFTTLPPVATGNTFAIFKLPDSQILVVRADGPVVVRRGILFHGVTEFAIYENMNGVGFALNCSDGSSRYPIDKFQYRAWTKDQHPASFKYLPLEDGGSPCANPESSF